MTRILEACPLFEGIPQTELVSLLDCLSAQKRAYAKDAFIFRPEGETLFVGVVLSGGVHVTQEDFWGNRMILAHFGPGEMFGEAFACAGLEKPPVGVMAAEKTEILAIDYRKIMTTCPTACTFHARLILNMLRVLAQKNILLTRKMQHLSKRTTREKLLSYLSAQALNAKTQNGAVVLPFNRQELADYLCVDRSALSRELSAMQNENLLRYDKNQFTLLR